MTDGTTFKQIKFNPDDLLVFYCSSSIDLTCVEKKTASLCVLLQIKPCHIVNNRLNRSFLGLFVKQRHVLHICGESVCCVVSVPCYV